MQPILNGNKFLKQKFWLKNKGISVIEILIIIGIIVIVLTGLLNLTVFSLKNSTLIKETNQANFLAQEAIEAVRNFRNGTDWHVDGIGALTFGAVYHQEKDNSVSPTRWILIEGEETIGQFTREIVFFNVQRDNNNNIVESGGINDLETKKITIIVSWKRKKVEITTYLTNWKQ